MSLTKEQIAEKFKEIQQSIIKQLEECDGLGKFSYDVWERKQGGGGITRVIQNGSAFDKGGVNFSAVFGDTPEFLKKEYTEDNKAFYATGVSIVIHPHNPFVPIIHMNIRYFELNEEVWWFGGGIDLTPHYVNVKEVSYFHNELKKVCDKHDSFFYTKFSKWADEYFLIKHRGESRGIGGIFFDRLGIEGHTMMSKNKLFDFVCDIGNSFAPIYTKLVNDNRTVPFGAAEKAWQMLRRGRYVEFNLVYDKGTKFGLETDGRIESILMSLPRTASWEYDYHPEKGSQEEKTLEFLKKN